MPSRRNVLATVGAGVVGWLAGCAAVPAPRPEMDLTVNNYRAQAVEVSVELFREDVAERSQARVYRNTVSLDGAEGDSRTWTAEALAPSRSYRVELRVDADGSVSTAHYHYRPDCESGDEVGLQVNIRENGVSVDQSACSGNAPFV